MRLHAIWSHQPYAAFVVDHKKQCDAADAQLGLTASTAEGEINLGVGGLDTLQRLCTAATPPIHHPFWAFLEGYGNRTSVLTDTKQLEGCFTYVETQSGDAELPPASFGSWPSSESASNKCCYAGQLEFTFTSSGTNKNEFSAIMQTGISHDRAASYLSWLRSAVWIDKQTRQIKVTVPLFNGNHGRVNVAVFKIFFDTSGWSRKEVSYVSIPLFAGGALGLFAGAEMILLYIYLVVGTVYIVVQLRYEYRALRGCCDAVSRCFCSCNCCRAANAEDQPADPNDEEQPVAEISPETRDQKDQALLKPTAKPGVKGATVSVQSEKDLKTRADQEEKEALEEQCQEGRDTSYLGKLKWKENTDDTVGEESKDQGCCFKCMSICGSSASASDWILPSRRHTSLAVTVLPLLAS
jgi:hypothetical protein